MANFWDWAYLGVLFIIDYLPVFFATAALMIALILSFMNTLEPEFKTEIEKEPPQIPEGVDAWEVDKNSKWLKYYLKHCKFYPRNGCTYFWTSALLIIYIASEGILAVVALPILIFIFLGFALLLFFTFTKFPIWVLGFTLSYYHLIIAAIILAGALYKFFTSRIWKFTVLCIKSIKEKHCLPIRYR